MHKQFWVFALGQPLLCVPSTQEQEKMDETCTHQDNKLHQFNLGCDHSHKENNRNIIADDLGEFL